MIIYEITPFINISHRWYRITNYQEGQYKELVLKWNVNLDENMQGKVICNNKRSSNENTAGAQSELK